MTELEKLEECRKLIQSWAYLGYNGSPFTEEQAIRLSNLINNQMCKEYERIFGKLP